MKRKLAVLLTAATVFSAILPTTCMAAEKKADIPEGTTISFWHAMGGVNGEALDYLVNKFNEENEYGIKAVIHDPVADIHEAKNEYGIEFTDFDKIKNMDAVIFAVSHEFFAKFEIS